MTVGEKIQKYRKEAGLSQEELGQKLLVSRQTISLWEMDKTLPTIDNLKRLKEIFGVSIDDMLEESPQAPTENIPFEKCCFELSDEQIREYLSINVKLLIPRAVLQIILIAILLVACINLGTAPFALGVTVSAIVALRYVFMVRTLIVNRKRSYERFTSQKYEYSIFEDHFIVDITSKSGDPIYRRKCFFDQICRVHETKSYFLIVMGNVRDECFVLPKSELLENSFIYAFQRKYPTKVKRIPFQHTLNILFFVGAILSCIAFCVITYLLFVWSFPYDVYHGRLWWLYFLLALFPVSCTVIGILQKRRKEGSLLKIVIPIILSAYFILAGSLSSHYGYPYSKFEDRLYELVGACYENPEILHVFHIEKDSEIVDYACILETDNYGIVVGKVYFQNGKSDAVYFYDFAIGMERDVQYGYVTADRDYYVAFKRLTEIDTRCYMYKEITVDGQTEYVCIYVESLN